MPTQRYNIIKELAKYNKANNTSYKFQYNIYKATFEYDGTETLVKYFRGSADYLHTEYISDFCTIYLPTIGWKSFKDFILSNNDTTELILEIWPPNKLCYAYLQTNYIHESGTLGNSCMRKTQMQKSLNFYIQNNVQIVVLHDKNNKIYARALLWPNVHKLDVKKTYTFLDRIYFISSHYVSRFKALADKEKWLMRNDMNDICMLYKDNIDITGITHVPYADTLRRLYFRDGILVADNFIDKNQLNLKYPNAYVELSVLNEGGYNRALDPNAVQEALSGNWMSKKDGIKVKRYDSSYDGYVHKANIVDINGAYYSTYDTKNITKSKIDGWLLKSDVVTEVLTNDVINKNNAIKSDKYKGYIHNKNKVIIHDEVYHKKDSVLIRYGRKYYLLSQCFRNYIKDDRGNIVPADEAIPKIKTLIAYHLEEDKYTGELKLSEHYLPNKSTAYFPLQSGELIIDTSTNRKLLKKFKNKYYLISEFEPPDKNQLKLF